MPQGEDWLTTDEIAKDLKVNVKTVRNWINSGEFVALDIGGEHRVSRDDYNTFIKLGVVGDHQFWHTNRQGAHSLGYQRRAT
ncbi:DNA-binding protein [Ktedonosporobacter rubrisoli]|uniref:DNA-binding protein n=1 Tax=Ktedonosporobacter rubrisoli TaxID=2509675 RepID=A0A4P6K2J7_KTERU|nr:DNA-binding protein [Ktedonosporobacter rubrisoli]